MKTTEHALAGLQILQSFSACVCYCTYVYYECFIPNKQRAYITYRYLYRYIIMLPHVRVIRLFSMFVTRVYMTIKR